MDIVSYVERSAGRWSDEQHQLFDYALRFITRAPLPFEAYDALANCLAQAINAGIEEEIVTNTTDD
jgi:hypothetical protein